MLDKIANFESESELDVYIHDLCAFCGIVELMTILMALNWLISL